MGVYATQQQSQEDKLIQAQETIYSTPGKLLKQNPAIALKHWCDNNDDGFTLRECEIISHR
jgi:hypothetical protein